MEVTKEKNLLKFHLSKNNNIYILDINTCSFCNEKTGKELKRFPNGFKRELIEWSTIQDNKQYSGVANLLTCLINGSHYDLSTSEIINSIQSEDLCEYQTFFSVVDKLDSANIDVVNYISNIRFHSSLQRALLVINDHFTDFIKWWNNDVLLLREDMTLSQKIDLLEDFPREYEINHFIKKYPAFAQFLEYQNGKRIILSIKELIKMEKWGEQEIQYAIYYLKKDNLLLYCIKTYHEGILLERIAEYFQHCKDLNIPYEKTSFTRTFIEVDRMYTLKEQEILNDKLSKKQPNILSYETDDFAVIVPKTIDEFIQEGNNQHNCVGSYPNRVLNNYCYVVFIRDKQNIEQSLITCDINPANGGIYQYLLKYNTRLENGEKRLNIPPEKIIKLLDFKLKYQNYLNSILPILKEGEKNV